MRRFLLLVLTIFTICEVYGQQVEGDWYGELNVGSGRLHLVFHISKTDSGYTSTMDSPDQSVKGIPVSATDLKGDTLSLSIAALGASYKGVVRGDGEIEGVFSQNGAVLALNLSRERTKVNRPEEPHPPYPYVSEDVVFVNKTAGVTLAGTLTKPAQSGAKFPCVVLVTGSGAQNRDEELLGHKPFAVIAHYLTRSGIAVLRYDDRGVGQSGGKFDGATTADFLTDALAAVDFLSTCSDIDKRKIGILGHSEGGTIALMAAAENPRIGYVISLAAMAQRGDSLLLKQNETMMRGLGMPAQTVSDYVDVLREIFRMQEQHTKEYVAKNQDTILICLSEKLEKLPDDLRKNAIAVLGNRSEWLDYFKSLDPRPYIAKIRCPVMAINGSKDVQVDATTNLEIIMQNLHKGKGNVILKYDSLNHLFQKCETGMPAEYGAIEQTISPEVLADITNFILTIRR